MSNEQEVLQKLEEAETTQGVLDAVSILESEQKTPESYALISAAGYMIGEDLLEDTEL